MQIEPNDNVSTDYIASHDNAAKIDIATAVTAAAFNKKQTDKVSSAANIPFILDPTSKRMQQWDVIMMLLLLYTATITPFEIAFLVTDPESLLFFINRVVDACFIFDMVFNFLLAFESEDDGLWIISHRLIARRYLYGWFTIDLMSCIPYSIIAMAVESSAGAEAAESLSQLKILRVIRLLRLAKLLRVVRASRMLKRWETKLALSYAMMTLIKFAILVSTLAHWIACGLAIVPQLEMAVTHNKFPDNWLVSNGLDGADASEKYLRATYWAIMTISTVGYGDVALPTPGEKIMGIIAMCVGGAAYAYIVGAICGIVASMDEATAKFQGTMDTLAAYVRENKIPDHLKRRLTDYFYYQRELLRASHYTELLELMTPTLRGEVAVLANGPWVEKIPFFTPKQCSIDEKDKFVTCITMRLILICFAPEESVYVKGDPATHLYIIRRGIVGAHGRVLGTGNFFGEDVILRSSTRLWPVYCLTYLDVYTLGREDLHDILADGQFPTIQKSVRRAIMKLAFRRNVLTFLNSINPEQLRAAAGMAAAAAAAALAKERGGDGGYRDGDGSDNEDGSDVDSEIDYNDVGGAGVTTSVVIAAPGGGRGGNNKQSRVPRDHRLDNVHDSYEGTGGGSGGGGIGGSSGVGGHHHQTGPQSATTPHTPPGMSQESRENLLLAPKSIPPQLRCGICHLVAAKPLSSPAGHLYCEECIVPSLERNSKCPITKKEMTTSQLSNVEKDQPILFSIFENVHMRCAHHMHGCSWEGVASMFDRHATHCTFQSWVSTCPHCSKPVIASEMEQHLKSECQHYRCVKCAEKDQKSANHSEMHLKSTVVRLVLTADYRFGPTTPMDMTKMFAFHGHQKKPANLSRDALFNLLKSCYLGWKKNEVSAWEVRMVFGAAMSSTWFQERQRLSITTWLQAMAVASGWVEDKYPGRNLFECPYCLEHGEWVGIECGTCGQRWDLNGEHGVLLR